MINQASIIFTIVGLIIGFVLGRISKIKEHGIFIIDNSENAEVKWTLRLFVDPNDIPNGDSIYFKVIHDNQGSCE